MAVLDVVKAGHPVLKQIAEPVEHVNKKLRALIDDMAETMYETDGVGLAAPQVAVSKRIIVVDDHAGSGLIALINPEPNSATIGAKPFKRLSITLPIFLSPEFTESRFNPFCVLLITSVKKFKRLLTTPRAVGIKLVLVPMN